MNKVFHYKFIIAGIIIAMLIIAVIGALFKIMHWPNADEMLIASMLGAILLFGIILYDMIVSPIRKKAIWIITFCFAPLLVGLLYTFLRNDMLEGHEI
jgi:multisubunit Na+/H+ antiporter MnhE subunit